MRISDWSSDVCSSDLAVGGIDQMLELFRTAIGRFRCVGQNAVVTPVAVAGKLGDRHQLDGRHAEVGKPGDVLFHLGETAIQTDMGFVQHRLVPGTTEPAAVAPQIVVMGIDDRQSTRLNSSHYCASRMQSSARNNNTYHLPIDQQPTPS